MDAIFQVGYDVLDRGLVPDFVLRRGARILGRQRLREINNGFFDKNHEAKMKFIEDVKARQTITEVPERANDVHRWGTGHHVFKRK